MTFSELMTKPDLDEQGEVWLRVMELAAELDLLEGYKRQTILEAFLEATLDLAKLRPDEEIIQPMNDVRRFYLYASEVTNRRFDKLRSYSQQWATEKRYGDSIMEYRRVRNWTTKKGAN